MSSSITYPAEAVEMEQAEAKVRRFARRRRGSATIASPRKKFSSGVAAVILICIGLCFLIPIVWVLLASVDAEAQVAVKWPQNFTGEHYTEIWNWESTLRPLWNSAILSFGTAIITVIVAVLAAYPLSRFDLRFKKSFMYTVLFSTCLPITAMMVPVYALFVSFHLLDTLIGTILFMATTSLPMAIWMTKNFMDSIPISLEEAAWVDGASAMQTLWRIVVPLMRPGIAVVFVFVFTGAWGNFFVPFVLLFDPTLQPASVAIYAFFGSHGLVSYGKLASFSIIYSIPAIVLYMISQKLSGGGFSMAGGVKG